MQFLQPITQTYANRSYDGMEHAIFPSFFHGKCLDSKGREPDGCPNPDCPIVCGTPGSLVQTDGTAIGVVSFANPHVGVVSSPSLLANKYCPEPVSGEHEFFQHFYACASSVQKVRPVT